MQKQMEFWPDPEELQPTQEIWGNLNYQQQRKIIAALSRLIRKCVYLEKTKPAGEVSHEE